VAIPLAPSLGPSPAQAQLRKSHSQPSPYRLPGVGHAPAPPSRNLEEQSRAQDDGSACPSPAAAPAANPSTLPGRNRVRQSDGRAAQELIDTNSIWAHELMAAVETARGLQAEQLGSATEKLYVLLFQVPTAERLLQTVRNSPSGRALSDLLLASGPALHKDMAFVLARWLCLPVNPPPLFPASPILVSHWPTIPARR
jgi:hypothetical protein